MAGHLRNLQSFRIPRTVPRDRVSKYGSKRRKQERLSNMLRQRNGLPAPNVGRSDSVFESSQFGIIFAKMRDQVFECQEGMTDVGFSPVDEHAALRTKDDIAGIEIAVTQRFRDAQGLEATQSVLQCHPKVGKFMR